MTNMKPYLSFPQICNVSYITWQVASCCWKFEMWYLSLSMNVYVNIRQSRKLADWIKNSLHFFSPLLYNFHPIIFTLIPLPHLSLSLFLSLLWLAWPFHYCLLMAVKPKRAESTGCRMSMSTTMTTIPQTFICSCRWYNGYPFHNAHYMHLWRSI